jgi:dipeptidyl aminopeptidase/acylaminoacyl peptidase
MPLNGSGQTNEPMLHLADGVDGAVARAIDLGIADSTRLCLLGHSYGGYSVYGLLTDTHRYKAAVAINGLSDLVSLYGTFDPRYSRTEPNYSATIGPWYLEHYQGDMGVPPWVDPQRYIRNSPIFSADRVSTPLLILHGDLDYLGTQDEEFFTALYRLGRRAEYVRYLGESHLLASPANILDMWRRILAWFDDYAQVRDEKQNADRATPRAQKE